MSLCSIQIFFFFRSEDREQAPRLKTAENANIQPNPGLILRAEPTVTNILKVLIWFYIIFRAVKLMLIQFISNGKITC